MRILVLSRTSPIPPHTGGKLRVLQSLIHLSRCHEVVLVSLFEGNEDPKRLSSELHKYCAEAYLFRNTNSRSRAVLKSMASGSPYTISRFWSPEAYSFTSNILKKEHFDLVWCHFISTSVYCGQDCRVPVLLDTHNDDVLEWSRLAQGSRSPLKRAMGYLEAQKIARFRDNEASLFDIILVVSEEEAQLARRWAHKRSEIWLAPNGVDVEHYGFHVQERNNNKNNDIVLFCGAMDVNRNVEAVLFFIQDILPMLVREATDIEFRVVGRNPVGAILRFQDVGNITITGTVDDVRPHYMQAKVAVAPFRLGGGTKLKVLEAMAMGVPVVATSTGAQGLDVRNGIHLFIEDEPQSFAERVLMLLRNETERQRIVRNARSLVETKYSWKSLFEDLDNRLAEYMEARDSGRHPSF